jgi:Uncharacterized protein conserved in bacteria
MRPTFHLIPVEAWSDADPHAPLVRESLTDEGFIHCTDGADELLATAERYYRGDPRDFLALAIDLDRLTSPWRYDDPDSPYPHIYGPIDRVAIVRVVPVNRAVDGRFLDLVER